MDIYGCESVVEAFAGWRSSREIRRSYSSASAVVPEGELNVCIMKSSVRLAAYILWFFYERHILGFIQISVHAVSGDTIASLISSAGVNTRMLLHRRSKGSEPQFF
jgi:hypothetical protein